MTVLDLYHPESKILSHGFSSYHWNIFYFTTSDQVICGQLANLYGKWMGLDLFVTFLFLSYTPTLCWHLFPRIQS